MVEYLKGPSTTERQSNHVETTLKFNRVQCNFNCRGMKVESGCPVCVEKEIMEHMIYR